MLLVYNLSRNRTMGSNDSGVFTTEKSRSVDRSAIQFELFWPKVTAHKHEISPSY